LLVVRIVTRGATNLNWGAATHDNRIRILRDEVRLTIEPSSSWDAPQFCFEQALKTELIAEIESAVDDLAPEAYASAWVFQRAVQRSLENRGFSVVLEHPVERPGGRTGYIDIIARDPNGELVVIELDTASPRKKSIEKLKLVNATRIVVLRRSSGTPSALKRINDATREVDAVIIPRRLRKLTDS